MVRGIEGRPIEYEQRKQNILNPAGALVPRIAVWLIETPKNIISEC